jgi:hypothetical protein
MSLNTGIEYFVFPENHAIFLHNSCGGVGGGGGGGWRK